VRPRRLHFQSIVYRVPTTITPISPITTTTTSTPPPPPPPPQPTPTRPRISYVHRSALNYTFSPLFDCRRRV